MGNVIYWKQYDEPKKVYDPLFRCEREVSGQYECTDERVESFWIIGSMSAKPKDERAYLKGNLYFKNGDRWETPNVIYSELTSEQITQDLISRAEQYLQSSK